MKGPRYLTELQHFLGNYIFQNVAATLYGPALFLCSITFSAVATIGFSIVTSGGGNNLSPNEHIYPEHVTNEDLKFTYSFGPNLVSFHPALYFARVYSITLDRNLLYESCEGFRLCARTTIWCDGAPFGGTETAQNQDFNIPMFSVNPCCRLRFFASGDPGTPLPPSASA